MKKLNMQGGYMGFILRMLFVAIFSTTSMCWCVIAQPSLPAKCQASLPKILINSLILSEKDANALNNSHDFGQSDTVKRYWTAYSDRENNTTYMEPDASSAQCSALRFNETVRIAKIQNGFALVYVEPDKQIAYPVISADAKCRGWVPMKKLLLWQSCLANEKGIYNKALLCVNVDKSDEDTRNYGWGYFGPSESSSVMQLTTDMNFYYIMKRENGMTLLATQRKMDGAFSDQVLFCWVQEQSFVPWNTRLCFELTWKHEDVEYFADHNIKLNFYENDRFDSDPIAQISFDKKESSAYDQYLYRMKGDILRFPIFDTGRDYYETVISCLIDNKWVCKKAFVKKKDDCGRDFFKPVLFLTVEEFDYLLKWLAPVHEAALSSNLKDRTPYIEAMKALARIFAPSISDEDIAKLRFNHGQLVIDCMGVVVNGYTFGDLSDQTVIPDAEYQCIITDFSRKFRNLSHIRASKSYKFVKEFNSAKYYWIPVEDLPL